MAQDPAFLVMYKDILVSCADWDADVLGWFFRLLCHQADKPGGLPVDLESLASLAGVKFSQFERFSSSWKRMLAAEFEATEQGLLINDKQDELLSDRRKYKEKQALRGLVGAYVKKAKALNKFTPHQLGLLSESLFLVLSPENSKEDNEGAYKHTLTTFIGNAIVNVNTVKDSLEGAGNLSPDIELPAATLEVAELSQFTLTQNKNTEFIKAQWRVFLTERINDPPAKRTMYQNLTDYTSYFLNWIRTKHPKNGTAHKQTLGSTQFSPTLAAPGGFGKL